MGTRFMKTKRYSITKFEIKYQSIIFYIIFRLKKITISLIQIKVILIQIHNIFLKNWEIDHINKDIKTFGKISKSIYFEIEYS